MSEPTSNGQGGKSGRRLRDKTANQADSKKVKLTLYVDAESAKRFGVHAVCVGKDRSELFREMIAAHCRRFVVSDRDKPPEE